MGTSNAKQNQQENNRWLELKKKQITEIEEQQLGERIGVPFESIQKAVHFLQTKRYIVENGLLGMGGCGLVMKACSEDNDYLAIKFMINPSASQVKQCQQEYQILKQFDSPYLIKVVDSIAEQHENVNYQIMVMERCAYDLKSYLSRSAKNKQPPTHSSIYKLCLELAKGLYVLHQKNILHLDIKPGNILFGVDLKWKYADLGISKALESEKDHTEHLGGYTVQYASPEQYQLASCHLKKIITKASDVYSLGIVFMQLTGVDIHQKWIVQEKFQQGNYDRFLNPDYEKFNDIIKRMVLYEPTERAEIEEVIVSLKQLIKRQYQESKGPAVPLLKKLVSNDKLDLQINKIGSCPPSETERGSVPQQERILDNVDTPKRRKIIRIQRKPSLKPIIVSGILSDMNLVSPTNNSPMNFVSPKNQISLDKSQSQSNTPILPKIRQRPSQIQNFSSILGQIQRDSPLGSPQSTQTGSIFLARKKQYSSAVNMISKFQYDSQVEDSSAQIGSSFFRIDSPQAQLGASFQRVDSPLIKTKKDLILPKLTQKQTNTQQEYINLNQQYQLNQYKIQHNNHILKQHSKVDSPLLNKTLMKNSSSKRFSFSSIQIQ